VSVLILKATQRKRTDFLSCAVTNGKYSIYQSPIQANVNLNSLIKDKG
jgi:hypothetical protein